MLKDVFWIAHDPGIHNFSHTPNHPEVHNLKQHWNVVSFQSHTTLAYENLGYNPWRVWVSFFRMQHRHWHTQKNDILYRGRIDSSNHHSQYPTCNFFFSFLLEAVSSRGLFSKYSIPIAPNPLIHMPWKDYIFLLRWCWIWQYNLLGSLKYISPHFDFGLRQWLALISGMVAEMTHAKAWCALAQLNKDVGLVSLCFCHYEKVAHLIPEEQETHGAEPIQSTSRPTA